MADGIYTGFDSRNGMEWNGIEENGIITATGLQSNTKYLPSLFYLTYYYLLLTYYVPTYYLQGALSYSRYHLGTYTYSTYFPTYLTLVTYLGT